MTINTKIETKALLSFSLKGFKETSIAEIAKLAKVSEASVFRLYNNKSELYFRTIENAIQNVEFDSNKLWLSLSMEDFQQDLERITMEFYAVYFLQIHLIRIYIANVIQVVELQTTHYLVIPQLAEFLSRYLAEMQGRNLIHIPDADKFMEMYFSGILLDVSFLTTFEKAVALNGQRKKNLEAKSTALVHFLYNDVLCGGVPGGTHRD